MHDCSCSTLGLADKNRMEIGHSGDRQGWGILCLLLSLMVPYFSCGGSCWLTVSSYIHLSKMWRFVHGNVELSEFKGSWCRRIQTTDYPNDDSPKRYNINFHSGTPIRRTIPPVRAGKLRWCPGENAAMLTVPVRAILQLHLLPTQCDESHETLSCWSDLLQLHLLSIQCDENLSCRFPFADAVHKISPFPGHGASFHPKLVDGQDSPHPAFYQLICTLTRGTWMEWIYAMAKYLRRLFKTKYMDCMH